MDTFIENILKGVKQWVEGIVEEKSYVIAQHVDGLTTKVASIEESVEDIDVIRGKANVGATAIQEVPVASSSVSGTVKVGSGLQMNDGVLSAQELAIATDSTLGGVKVGDGLEVTQQGVLSTKAYKAEDVVIDNTPSGVVDLGLASGTLWAQNNLGANSETDFGNYYQFGTALNEDFDWSTPFVDAATTELGSGWRVPTKEECQELKNLDYEFVSNYNNTGVNVIIFTGTNGNTLVLPLGGCYNTTDENEDPEIGAYGYFLTSDEAKDTDEYCLLIEDESVYVKSVDRYFDMFPGDYKGNIRPVYTGGGGSVETYTKSEFAAEKVFVNGVGSYDGTNSDEAQTLQDVVKQLPIQRSLKITHDANASSFPIDSTQSDALNTLTSEVAENTWIPVRVELYEGSSKEGDVLGFAMWKLVSQSDEKEVTVTIGHMKFTANAQEVSQEYTFTSWTRTAIGQSFFT